jgi:hypothetical protein
MKVNREEKPCVAIADPYFLREGMLLNPGNHSRAKEYLQKFLLDNKSKKDILLPYFPDSSFSNILSFQLFCAETYTAH